MSNRTALVQINGVGTAYPMYCPNTDIATGDDVEVLMWANKPYATWMEGTVTKIVFRDRDCSHYTCHVKNKIGGCDLAVNHRSTELALEKELHRRTVVPLFEVPPDSMTGEMRELYQSIAHEIGEHAYLCDGVWLSPDGELHE